MNSITTSLNKIVEQDHSFEIMFGTKKKAALIKDRKVVIVPSDKANLEKSIEQFTFEDIDGFLIYQIVGNSKEFLFFALKKHDVVTSNKIFSELKGNKLHLVANAPIIKSYLDLGIKVDRMYENEWGESMVVLSFSNSPAQKIFKD